jgi:hypothetical protein
VGWTAQVDTELGGRCRPGIQVTSAEAAGFPVESRFYFVIVFIFGTKEKRALPDFSIFNPRHWENG